jgi:hypothetical protein
MNMQDYELYWEEIVRRSELALDAIGQLNFSVSNLNRLSKQSHQYHQYHNEVFHSIHIFLTHTGEISLRLWPGIPPRGKDSRDAGGKGLSQKSKNQITKDIKKRLPPAGRALLRDWTLRGWFNERTEQSWLQSLDQDGECYVLGSPLLPGYPSPHEDACYYDPISRNFHFKGETHNIQDIAAVIFMLLSIARDEQRKQRASLRRAEPVYSRPCLQMTM